MLDVLRINSGELIGLKVLKIKSIPHISILTEDLSPEGQTNAIVNVANNMAGMLNEVYQLYKGWYTKYGMNPDVALEITWATRPVENQPYKADIDLYLVIRAINNNQQLVEQWIGDIMTLLSTTLHVDKYEFAECDTKEYVESLMKCNNGGVQAIVREERTENLQVQFLPVAYAYDLIPRDYPDFSRMANILISNPYSALSFQVIPTYLRQEELAELDNLNQVVSMLSHGVQDRLVGNMSVSAADKVSMLYKYYAEHKSRPLFHFNVLLYGSETSLSSISSRVVGQLSATQYSTPNFKLLTLNRGDVLANESAIYAQPWVVSDGTQGLGRNMAVWQSGVVSSAFYRFPYIATSDELANFFRLPVGSDKVNAGLRVNETNKNSKTYSKNLINAGDIILGKLKSSSMDDSIGLSLKDLAKHMLVVGTPGSGKTTFSVGLLDRLWKDHKIPFLVIEPAKNEYRALVQSIPELQVFTPGKNFISPFVFNPFVPPKNVKLETYKSTLKTAFAAGVSMSSPLDKIFEDAVNNCYSDFRWLDSYTIANKGGIFNIADFIKCFQQTFDDIGYTGDARNIGRAGVVRLKSLVNLFDNYFSIPIEDILSKPTIIELAAIENADQKALIIALLLLSILAYVNANYVGEGGLRNFILLEEAHVLLDSQSKGGEGSADPAAIAQGLVKRMLAEIRSYGVGLAIADQSPRKVGIDIVALTDIKVAFRLVESQDKQILADSTSMSDIQTKHLAKLKPGEAFLFFNRLDEPEEIVTPDYRLDNNISISLSDEGIRELTTYWNDKADKLRPYPECAHTPYCKRTCVYERRLLAREVVRRIFNKHIKAGAKEFAKLEYVFANIVTLVKNELNDEVFDRELLSCVRVHLMRKVRYETSINVSERVLIKTLMRE